MSSSPRSYRGVQFVFQRLTRITSGVIYLHMYQQLGTKANKVANTPTRTAATLLQPSSQHYHHQQQQRRGGGRGDEATSRQRRVVGSSSSSVSTATIPTESRMITTASQHHQIE